ncbi:spore germination protein [Cytobacillus spongiae]|jgi:spore germination protein|uniref:spore germination protein n=1 Tax=Cytobacillus spongiae TaxID=2901381 RepID=UPI001F191787|nr:spore germination protein [Cytobacillus spongiae]UII57106.1 spore germination protein [Cytobacillus spongiae]
MNHAYEEVNQRFFKEKLEGSIDCMFQELSLHGQRVDLIYLKSICDTDKVHQMLVKPFFEINEHRKFDSYVQSLDATKPFETNHAALSDVLRGSVVLVGPFHTYVIDLKKYINQGVKDANVETTIQGPQTALSEDIAINMNLIRHRYHQPSLKIENEQVGSVLNMEVILIYDSNKVQPEILQKIKEKIASIKNDNRIVQSPGEFHRLLTPKKRTLFPVYMISERTDRIALNLSEGKVVLLIEGSPFALILPAVFFDFMSSMEDFYQPYWVSKFLLSLRYIGLFISLVLPGFYIGITSYNPELFQVQLALGIAGSRAAVPYSSYLEVFFMLFMMELLTEASIRLPKSIGSTATTVGGLILGTAATEAGLVSNIMIIIVSAVAISNFVIPINEMSFAMRVMKYIIAVLATVTGLIGIVVGMLVLITYLIRLDSFGQPYLRLYFSEANKD